ncbi:MAG: HEAT repeat domain-containing protein [Planctomycetota bacterium]|nr:HEAT repeat domain-containing protein [Planctomycetota bacterium]
MDDVNLCFERIRRPSGFLDLGKPARLHALARFAELGQPKHAGWIFHLLVEERDEELAAGAADAVRVLMRNVQPEDWTGAATAFRHLNLTNQSVARLAQFTPDQAVHALGIATLSYSGYVREDALRRLGAIRHRDAFPYLVLRLADWVPPIRVIARDLLLAAIDADLGSRLHELVHLLPWMKRISRVDLNDVGEAIVRTLVLHHSDELRQGLDNESSRIRDFCYQALLVQPGKQPDLVEKALADPDLQIRLWLLRRISAEPMAGAGRWMSRFLDDPIRQIRVNALQVIPGSLLKELEPQIDPMIFDDSRSVREAARFCLGRNGARDFAGIYRACVRQEGNQAGPGAVAGLAETGAVGDCEMLQAFEAHPKAGIRAAALMGAGRLKPDEAMPRLVAGLDDRNAKVRLAAARGLIQNRASGTFEAVKAVLENGTRRGRLAAFGLLAQMGSWEALRSDLYAIASDDELLVAAGWNQLAVWHQRNWTRLYTKPAPPLAQDIRRLAAAVDRLPRPTKFVKAEHWSQIMGFVGSI